MRKIILTLIMMTAALGLFAGDSLPLLGNEYTIRLSNITRINSVNFSKDNTLVADGPVTISESNGVITLSGSREVSVISLTFPESKEFTVTSGGVFTFKNRFFTLTGRNEKQFIRFDKNGFFLQNNTTVVKISDGVVSIRDDDGDRVEISKKGTVIKGDEEHVRLGILGKFISYVVRKAVVHNIDSPKIIADTLTLVAQEEEIDVDVVGGTFNVNVDQGNVSISTDDMKIDKTTYSQVSEVDAKIVSSSIVLKRSSDSSFSVEVKRPKNLPSGYSYSIEQKGKKLVISEKFTGSVRMSTPIVFTLYVPSAIEGVVKTVSGTITVNDLKFRALELLTVSGDINVVDAVSQKKTVFKTVSGMISVRSLNDVDATISSTSGELMLKNITAATLSASVSSGDIYIHDSTVDTMTLKTTSGDSTMKNVKLKALEYSSVSGDIEGESCTIDIFNGKSISGDAVFNGSTLKKKTFSSTSGSMEM